MYQEIIHISIELFILVINNVTAECVLVEHSLLCKKSIKGCVIFNFILLICWKIKSDNVSSRFGLIKLHISMLKVENIIIICCKSTRWSMCRWDTGPLKRSEIKSNYNVALNWNSPERSNINSPYILQIHFSGQCRMHVQDTNTFKIFIQIWLNDGATSGWIVGWRRTN